MGICVANLDAKLLERGELTSPGSGRRISFAIALIRKVGRLSRPYEYPLGNILRFTWYYLSVHVCVVRYLLSADDAGVVSIVTFL